MSAREAREGALEDFTTGAIAHGGFEVDEHGTGNVLAGTRLRENVSK